MTSNNAWRKSSYSGGTSNNCVLVHRDLAALRDAKNPTNVVITVDVTGLIAAVRADRIG